MQLINTDGMVFIGPGSEWFWTAISGIVLAVTFVAIYRQLRLQADEAAVNQVKSLDREWLGSERMARLRVAALEAIRDGSESATLPHVAMDINDFWEAVSHLVRSNHMDRQMLNEQRSQSVRLWWGWLAPTIRAERARREAPWIGEGFEWLADTMAAMDLKAGRTTSFDQEYVDRMLPSMLAYNLEAVRLAEELRSVVARPTSPAALAPGAGATQQAPSAAPAM